MAFVVAGLALALVALGVIWLRSSRSLRSEVRELAGRVPQGDEGMATGVSGAPATDPRAGSHIDGQLQFADALLAAGDGVVVVDSDGRELLRNAAAGRFVSARHADALVEEAINDLLDRARGGERGERELQLFGPPREVLQLRALPLQADGRVVGAVAFVRDVSEARRVESVRRDFVANVSHELKTPIGALALLAETMAASPDDPTVLRQLAERVQREADRLSHIIDDLLDLSLIEAQEAPIRESVPVAVLLSESSERVRAAADTAGIPLEVESPSPSLIVACDRRQVVGAITNLLDNAVKYSEAGHPVELSAEAEDEYVCIVVRDDGIGIPSRDLERIFERFYRVDRARSRATGGTGLGLSIVRHIAQAHGGDVTVSSREGEGSTFRFKLAASARPARPTVARSEVAEAS
ncbi:MAG TPA: ATP-binding protein [Acidimicrobiia bacterium]|nr:ATP-binding protein [Acidimicrobiia bacterium]